MPSLPVAAFFGVTIALFTYGMIRIETHLQHGFLLDDAYISLRYAHNFAAGKGLVFNAGERVEGYTNFLMTMVMSVPFFVGCDPVTFVKTFGWLTGVSLILSTGELTRRLAGPLACAVVMLVMALDLHFAWWCDVGLETMLVSALYVPALLLLDRRRLVGASVFFSLAALTRMETVLLFVTAFVFLFLRSPFRLARPLRTWPKLRPLLRFGVPFTVIFGAYFVARFAYYGWLFPNTYYAKVGTVQAAWHRGLEYLENWTRELHLETAVPVVGAGLAIITLASLLRPLVRRIPFLRPRGGLGALVASSCSVYAAYVVSVGGDHFAERFVYHFYPLLLGTMAWTCRAVLDVTTVSARLRRAAPLMAGGVLLLLLRSFVGTGPTFGPASGIAAWATAGIWLREQGKDRPPPVIATDAAGVIPYESNLTAIDILGLCDEHIAHLDVPLGKGVAGHEKADPGYVLDRNPDFVTTWVDADGHVGRGFRRFYRFWRDYELAATIRTDERFDTSLDRLKVIAPGVPASEIALARRGRTDAPGNYDWGIWKRRVGPVPRRWFGRQDFGSPIAGATEHEDALIEVPRGHPPARVMFGPFLELPAGRYALSFDVEFGSTDPSLPADAELCRFDVWDGSLLNDQPLGNGVWANRSGTVSATIDVVPERAFRPMEIRIACPGLVALTVRRGWLETCANDCGK